MSKLHVSSTIELIHSTFTLFFVFSEALSLDRVFHKAHQSGEHVDRSGDEYHR